MTKYLLWFFVQIARFGIKSILWVIYQFRRRNEKYRINKKVMLKNEAAQNIDNKKKVTEMTEAKITDRASNLTETQRAKIQAHLNLSKKQQQSKPQYLSEAHKKNSEAAMDQIAKWQANPPTTEQALERQRIREEYDQKALKAVQELSKRSVSRDEIDRQIDESFKVHGQKNPNTRFNSFDWTTLTKNELDELYHQIIDKALENYEYRLHVLFKWKINHEEFHYRAVRSLAIRIRREEQRLKKHQTIGDYFEKRWANMTPEEAKADRQWILDQGRLRNLN